MRDASRIFHPPAKAMGRRMNGEQLQANWQPDTSRGCRNRPRPRVSGIALALTMILAGIGGATMSKPAMAQGVSAKSQQQFSIPAGSLREALDTLASRSGITVMYSPDLVAGKTTSGLSGGYTPIEALRHLLQGSGLEAQDAGGSTFTLKRTAPPAPNPIGARLQPPLTGARQQSQVTTEMESIVVTGSRLARHVDQGASPVTQITQEDIKRSGASTAAELLKLVPQSAGSIAESSSGAFLGGTRVQLRGLSAGSTLILINGRPVQASASQFGSSFDLNNIPLQAVDRVEVLTDTATAVYGADAVGGVVNFILKKDYSGFNTRMTFGRSYSGDAGEFGISVTGGGSNGNSSGLFTVQSFERDPVLAIDRGITSSQDYRRYGGSDFRSTFSYPANIYALPGSGNLPGLNTTFAGTPIGTNGVGLTPEDYFATAGVLNRFDAAPYTDLVAESSRQAIFATGTYAFDGGSTEAFVELLYTRNHQVTQAAPPFLYAGAAGVFVVPANNPFNPFGAPVGVDYSFAELGSQKNDAVTTYSRMVVGLKGELGSRFNWQAFVLQDNDNTDVLKIGNVSYDAIRQYLNSTDPNVALNVFSSNANNSPNTLAALRRDVTDVFQGATQTIEASINGALFDLPAGSVQALFGASMRRDEYDVSGASVFNTNRTSGDRESWAAFGELSVPIVSDRPLFKELELTFASRLDHYDLEGIDSQTNSQIGLLWRPVDELLIRGSYGSAYKVPTLQTVYGARTSGPAVFNDPDRNNQPASFIRILGGNPAIQPEKAEAYSYGFIWEPRGKLAGLVLGVNLFHVRHTDFISAGGDVATILNNPELFGERIQRAPPTEEDLAQGLPGALLSVDASAINFGEVEVSGADVDVSMKWNLDRIGELRWTTRASYVDQYELKLSPGADPESRLNQASTAGYPLRFQGNTQLQWEKAGWQSSATIRYRNSYKDFSGSREIPATTLVDLQVGKTFGNDANTALSNTSISIGATNLFNRQGPFANTSGGYDPFYADMRGRFFYLSLDKSF